MAPAVRVQADSANPNCGTGVLADPATPDQSVLYLRVAGSACGTLMPLGGAELTDDEKACVLSWIEGL
jgi:hypothetical protein